MADSLPGPAVSPVARGGIWGERRSLTLGLLLVVTLVAFEALAVATVLPLAGEELGSLRLYGWAFSAFLLASLVGIVWAGEQSDRHGPARPFVIGLVLFAAGLAVAGFAPSMWVLVAGRAIQGLGAGVVPAVAYVAIGRAYEDGVRPRILALFSTAWVVPGLVGPGAAAAIAETTNWRLVFLGLLPLVVVAAALALPGLRALGGVGAPTTVRRVPRAIALAAGVGLLLAGLTSPSPWLGAPLALAGAVVAVWTARRLLPAGTLRGGRGLPSVIAGHGLLQFAFFGMEAFVPFTLITLRGESTFLVGAGLSITAVAWTAGTWVVDRAPKRFDRRVAMALGMVLVAVEAGLMALVVADSTPVVVAVAAWTVGAFGIGLAYPAFSLAALASAAPGEEGATSSALKLVESLGAALGTGAGGAIVAAGDALGTSSGGAATVFGLMALGALVGAGLARRTSTVAWPGRKGRAAAAQPLPS